jgi:GntR family transcriptional regulator
MTCLSNQPLYLQLRAALVERIAAGEWGPGTAIPNEGDLAREFGVSPGTIRKSLHLMENEHLVTRRQGRGTFVNDQRSDKLASRFTNIRGANGERIYGQAKSVKITEVPAGELECERLNLKKSDPVYRIGLVRYHEGKPFMVEAASMPAKLFPGLVDEAAASHRLVGLAQQYGLLLGSAEERLSIGTASADVAKSLEVSPAAPVIVLDRVVHTLDDRPIEWRVGWCNLVDAYYLAEMC